MGGKILEFKGEKLYRKAVKEGIEQGEERGEVKGKVLELVGLVNDGLLPERIALKRAEDRYGVSAEKFKELMASADTEDERLQG